MPAQRLVYEGPDPEVLLAQVQADHGPSFRLAHAEQRRHGGVGGFFAKVVYRVEVEPDSTPDPAVAAATAGALERMVSETEDRVELAALEPANFDDVLAGVAGVENESETVPPEPAPDAPAAEESAARRSPVEPEPPDALPVPVAPTALDPVPAGGGGTLLGRTATLLGLLRFAGFPKDLLGTAETVLGETVTLERVFWTLPSARPLPDVPGSLIVVAGDPQAALRTARATARQLAVPAGSVAVAAPGRRDREGSHLSARTAEEATALSPGWRRDRIGIVALSAAPLSDLGWAREMLRAMTPSYVLGIVSATTKTEDVERWANGLGGVDALVLTDAAKTATPAAVLGCDIPVATIDGDPATPRRWADVVTSLVTDL